MNIIFSPKYTVKTPGHVFRADKFEAALKLALREGYFKRGEIVAPPRPTRADLELAHTRDWARKCLACKFTPGDSARAELKITRAVAEAHLLNTGGTIKAVEFALEGGVGLNCGGGSHHAFADGGEGFCLINDIAVAIRKFMKAGRIKRAMVIDLDAHQGNGTAAILGGDRRVFTLSMHNDEIYPEKKGRSSLDIGLRPGWRDGEYLPVLRSELPRALDRFKPDFAIYVAGADVYRGDLLGGLKLSMGGIKRRDAFVLRECRRRGVPVAVTLSGGYAKKFSDTVRIHANTLIEAVKAFRN
jgi:acetoin utilization deacetylase AcuC-like enzyme